ncbi:MAG: hypothetical protein KJ058_15645 [Thermoanaerobaculia bacterium]|nr:hypothetical protein [Thermoanaerobaculia bacterium]MCZ7650784.1 hypothetical protein [Thermoanaerobaculia bacterium]
MSEPRTDPPFSGPPSGLPIAPGGGGAPFAPGRAPAPSGCGRLALVGCGISTLLLGIAAVVFLFKADDLLAWTLRKMEAQIAEALPPEVTPEERDRFRRAFAEARDAIGRGDIDPAALQRLQRKLASFGGRSGENPAGREEILDLVAALEAVPASGGTGGAPSGAGSAAAPEDASPPRQDP